MRSDRAKANRKAMDRVNRRLGIVDALAPPSQPYNIVYHPRAFSKSPWCQAGMHDWVTDTLMNIPILKCRKCGEFRFKGVYEGTETKREIRTRGIPEPYKEPTEKELIEKIWKRMNKNDRR